MSVDGEGPNLGDRVTPCVPARPTHTDAVRCRRQSGPLARRVLGRSGHAPQGAPFALRLPLATKSDPHHVIVV
jgi:hypothetical protein